jgi:hypothetical protein
MRFGAIIRSYHKALLENGLSRRKYFTGREKDKGGDPEQRRVLGHHPSFVAA